MDRDQSVVQYLAVLRRRWVIVAVACLVGVTAALGYSAGQPTRYRAQASVLVAPDASAGFLGAGAVDQRRLLENEAQFLSSPQVAQAAAEILGYPASVAVGEADFGDVLLVSAIGADPARAADIANAYAEAFLQERRRRTIDDYLRTSSAVQTRLDDVEGRLDVLDADDPGRTGLERQRDAYLQVLGNLGLGADLAGGVDASVLAPAVPAAAPFQPRTARNAVLGAILGLLGGVAAALLRDRLDDRVRGQDDLEAATGAVPVLGVVPAEPTWRKARDAHLVSVAQPDADSAEAFRALRAAVQFLAGDRGVTTVQITSPHAGEGKTSTTANLAVALARAGRRVIVVDADLRRPRLHAFFGANAQPGLSEVLQREARLADVVQRPLAGEALALVTSGASTPIPSELLGGAAGARLFSALQQWADLVLVDSAPILPVADGLVLAGQVDATIIVAQRRRTTRRDLAATVDRLRTVDATILGTVLNRAERRGLASTDAPSDRRSGADHTRPPGTSPRRSARLDPPGAPHGRVAGATADRFDVAIDDDDVVLVLTEHEDA